MNIPAEFNPTEITHESMCDALDRLLLLSAEARAAYDYQNPTALADCLHEIMWILDNAIYWRPIEEGVKQPTQERGITIVNAEEIRRQAEFGQRLAGLIIAANCQNDPMRVDQLSRELHAAMTAILAELAS